MSTSSPSTPSPFAPNMAESGTKQPDPADELSDGHRPDLAHNIWFWLGQVVYWLGYAIITILYVPWAFAMHLVLGVAAIPLFFLCFSRSGRKVFIYFYVVTVMLPGKFIWFNAFVRTRRRGKVWDFEMGRPRPIPLQSRRRVSEDAQRSPISSQSQSAFLTKLPPEIRLMIYREIFVGASKHRHIAQRRTSTPRGLPPIIKINGYLCAREHSEHRSASCNCMLGGHAHNDPPEEHEIRLPKDYNRGKLALIQTCKQVYSEAIEQLYRDQKFCFSNLEQPPFFLRSVLPSRLALIRKIQLCYKQANMTSPRGLAGSSHARYLHRVQQCSFCNLSQWLRLLRKTMTGLEQIEIFIYLDKKMPVPKLGQGWIVNLLKLQQSPSGGNIRKVRMKVFCNMEEPAAGGRSEYLREVKDFMKGLSKHLKRVAAAPPPTSLIGRLPSITPAPPSTPVPSESEPEIIGPISSPSTIGDD